MSYSKICEVDSFVLCHVAPGTTSAWAWGGISFGPLLFYLGLIISDPSPSTGELRKLPELEWICFVPKTTYGFCYDESNDDFKVFVVSPAHPDYNKCDGSRTHHEYKVFVYSLKCDFWRVIGDFPYKLVSRYFSTPGFGDGNFANGSISWSVTPQIEKKIIVSLDIKTETWQELLQPNFGDGVYNWTLGTFGKSLSVLCQWVKYQSSHSTEDRGVGGSWAKLFTIPYMDQLITHDSYQKPICISADGDIMLNLERTVVLYNLKNNTFKKLLAGQYFQHLEVYPYVESLVSPRL
ncbi:F-box/kelch-repeat protein At3g23880-like [Apium graveolens]|uniref:F-box/kelch-repeat protein At3g23880-like n=1 Tax=Apium graveolens TaxID=4045 RepID=UPI003D78D653